MIPATQVRKAFRDSRAIPGTKVTKDPGPYRLHRSTGPKGDTVMQDQGIQAQGLKGHRRDPNGTNGPAGANAVGDLSFACQTTTLSLQKRPILFKATKYFREGCYVGRISKYLTAGPRR